MCQLISTRQLRRSTTEPCFSAASSANAHCVGRACSPSALVEAIDSTPVPYLPASCIPLGLMLDAVAIGISSWNGRICSAASCSSNQSDV